MLYSRRFFLLAELRFHFRNHAVDVLLLQVKYVHVPYEAAKQAILKMLPEWQTDGVIELLKLVDDGASGAGVTDDFEALVGHAPLTIEQWTAQVGAAFK